MKIEKHEPTLPHRNSPEVIVKYAKLCTDSLRSVSRRVSSNERAAININLADDLDEYIGALYRAVWFWRVMAGLALVVAVGLMGR